MRIRLAAATVESMRTEVAHMPFSMTNGIDALLPRSCLPAPGASRPRYLVMVMRWFLRGALLSMRSP